MWHIGNIQTIMFGSKSPATFLTNLFDKGKEEEEVIQDDARGEEFHGRKRSQSMFAPNMAALISGDHVGSRGTITLNAWAFTDKRFLIDLREVKGRN